MLNTDAMVPSLSPTHPPSSKRWGINFKKKNFANKNALKLEEEQIKTQTLGRQFFNWTSFQTDSFFFPDATIYKESNMYLSRSQSKEGPTGLLIMQRSLGGVQAT